MIALVLRFFVVLAAFAALPAWTVRAAGVVLPMAREFADILHLWEAPVLLVDFSDKPEAPRP